VFNTDNIKNEPHSHRLNCSVCIESNVTSSGKQRPRFKLDISPHTSLSLPMHKIARLIQKWEVNIPL